MSDAFTLRQIAGLDRRISQTEVRETPPFGVGARVYNSANLSINSLTLTVLTFNAERYDPLGMHSTSRLTAPYTGKYHIGFNGGFEPNANGIRQFLLYLNGATYIAEHLIPVSVAGYGTRISMSTIYPLNAGDYVEVVVQQGSAGTLNIVALPNYSPEFFMHLLG